MPQYMLLIYEDEKNYQKVSEADGKAIMAAYGDFTASIQKAGQFKAGDALQPVATATTVRVKDGKTVKTDGPFAETKEQLGGYYLVDAKNLDEAIAIAARIPAARTGSIEVRPVMVMPQG